MSYEEMLYNFDLVVMGTDVRHVKSDPNVVSYAQSEDSEFKVSCVLKGDGQNIGTDIRIVAVYPSTSCLESVMQPGGKYIVGLERFGEEGLYRRHNVNSVQVVAFENNTENWSRALRVCGLQRPSLPTNAYQSKGYTFCQAGNPNPCWSPSFSGTDRRSVTFGFLLATFNLALWLLTDY